MIGTIVSLSATFVFIILFYVSIFAAVLAGLHDYGAAGNFADSHYSISDSSSSDSDNSDLDSSSPSITTSSSDSDSSSSSSAPVVVTGGGAITPAVVDNLTFTINNTQLAIGDPVSKLTAAGFTIDEENKNSTIDSSHYIDVTFHNGDDTFYIYITSDKDAATPIADGQICGVSAYADNKNTTITFSNGLKPGMSQSDFDAKFGPPSSSDDINKSDSGTDYTFEGTDKYNTELQLDFLNDAGLYSITFKKPTK